VSKKIQFSIWIALLGVAFLIVDKVIYKDLGNIEYKEIELYEPRANLEYRLTALFRDIRDKKYYEELNIENQKQTIDGEYVTTLLKYHNDVLGLYELTRSKEIALSLEYMSKELEKIFTKMNDASCAYNTDYGDFKTAQKELPLLLDKLTAKQQNLIKFGKSIRAAKPDYDQNGEYDTEAVINKIELINKLTIDPYLFVRFKKEDPFKDFNLFMDNFDGLHGAYKSCTLHYANDIEAQKNWKLFWQFLISILITVIVYRRDIL
jgi:hypothetical protein